MLHSSHIKMSPLFLTCSTLQLNCLTAPIILDHRFGKWFDPVILPTFLDLIAVISFTTAVRNKISEMWAQQPLGHLVCVLSIKFGVNLLKNSPKVTNFLQLGSCVHCELLLFQVLCDGRRSVLAIEIESRRLSRRGLLYR